MNIRRVSGNPNGENGRTVRIGRRDNGVEDHVVSMQIVQDIYNEITGKTESLSRSYNYGFKISFENLDQLNFKMKQLLEQYNVVSSNCCVYVYHVNESKAEFSSFDRFKLYDKTIASPCEMVVVKYNFLIVLPQISKPQSYKVTIRLGSNVAALHRIQGASGGIDTLMRMVLSRPANISIEYIDYTVARNIHHTIEDWLKGISYKTSRGIIDKFQDISHLAPKITRVLSLLVFSAFIFVYLDNIIASDGSTQQDLYFALVATGICGFGISFLFYTLGQYIEKGIDSVSEGSFIDLNAGDDKLYKEHLKMNKKGYLKVVFGSVATVVLGIVSSLVASYLIS
nr:hypothetical protein [uncultured Cohaesibacter sp.]